MGDFDISNLLLILPDAEVEVLIVLEEGGVILIELGDQLLERSGIFHDVVPVILNALEKTVRFIKASTLQLQHILWLLSHEIAYHIAWS